MMILYISLRFLLDWVPTPRGTWMCRGGDSGPAPILFVCGSVVPIQGEESAFLFRFSRTCVASFALAISAMAGTALLAPGTAVAQPSTAGTVTGQATDAQGAAIVGAVVILTNNA